MKKVRVYRCACFYKGAHWLIDVPGSSYASETVYFDWASAMKQANKLARRLWKLQLSSAYGKSK